MGQCILKLPHSCGSRNGLQVFEKEDGKIDGYCFSCKQYIENPLGEGKGIADVPIQKKPVKTQKEIEEEISFIKKLGAMDLVDRKLRKDSLDYYGIKVGLSEEDGKTPTFHYYPYTKDGELKAYKARYVPSKSMWSVGDQTDVDLFGWEQALKTGAKRLIITEGELDCVALKRIIDIYTKEAYEGNKPAVCSLPHGAASAKRDITRLLPKIRKHFKEVYLCFDDDKPGQDAIKDVCTVLPNAKVINLPAKDANACILEGKSKAAFNSLTFNAQKDKNTKLIFGEDLHESAREQAKFGELSWPWGHINQETRGIRYGETIYIGAGVKMG